MVLPVGVEPLQWVNVMAAVHCVGEAAVAAAVYGGPLDVLQQALGLDLVRDLWIHLASHYPRCLIHPCHQH